MTRFLAFLARLPCFADMRRRPSSTGMHFQVLDGARGIAALSVLLQHMFWPPENYGLIGVWLFFALSGFLLVQPFYAEGFSYAPRGLLAYFIRRLLRIVPMYWATVIFAAFIGYGPWTREWVGNHLAFIWADMVFWSIKQELAFYLLLPFLMLPLWFLSARSWVRPAALFALAALYGAFGQHMLANSNALHDPSRPIPFFGDLFVAGMAAGCLLHTAYGQALREVRHPAFWADGLLLALIAACLVIHPEIPGYPDTRSSWNGHFIYACLLSLALAGLVLLPRGLLHDALSFAPLRAIGIVGYSAYLLHDPLLAKLNLHGNHTLWPVLPFILLVYACSCTTYCLIEYPCMRLARRVTARLASKI